MKRHRLSEYEENLKNEEKEKTTVIECTSSGASIEVSSHKTSEKCPYCDSNIVMSDKVVSILDPDGIRPFSIDKKEAGNVFTNWVKKRKFAPNALKNLYQSGKIMGIYLPYWSFDNSAACIYTAEGGIDRKETYMEDGKEKTKTVTDWYAVRGNLNNDFTNKIIRASKTLKESLIKSLGGFNLGNTITYDSGYLSGYNSEIFKVPMREGYEEVKRQMNSELERMIESQILKSYNKVRNLRFSTNWNNEFYRLILLPVYSMSYSFNGKAYQVLINGENGTTVGEYPKSHVKVIITIVAVITAITLIIYLLTKK